MASGQTGTGTAPDIANRIRQLLPAWFGDSNPTANAVLDGAATALAFIYGLYRYAAAQTRILTASGIWLDLMAQDFYATAVQRRANQDDDSFRANILANLFRPRATRTGISDILLTLTGNMPIIVEPFVPADTGAYGIGYASYGGAGSYGSQTIPLQAFVTAFRPVQYGIAQVAGYGVPTAGYGRAGPVAPGQFGPGQFETGQFETGQFGTGRAEYASLALISSIVTDADIYAATAAAKAAGAAIWVRISNIWTPVPLSRSGGPFTLNGIQLTLS